MTTDAKVVDIDDAPDVARLAQQVRDTNEARVPRLNGEVLAEVRPVKPPKGRRAWKPTEADLQALRSSAGGWADMDIDRFLADIYASRDMSIGRKVEL